MDKWVDMDNKGKGAIKSEYPVSGLGIEVNVGLLTDLGKNISK